MRLVLCLSSFCIFFTGCFAPVLINQNGYKKEEVVGRTVLILPPASNSVFIRNPEDVVNHLPPDSGDVNQILRKAIYRNITETVAQVKDENNKQPFITDSTLIFVPEDTAKVFSLQLKVGPEHIPVTYYLPTKQWLIAKGKSPDIVLVISSIEYGREISHGTFTSTYVPGATISTPTGPVTTRGMQMGGTDYTSSELNGIFHFIIYDYVRDTWITYGIQNVSTDIPFWGLTQSNFESTFVLAAKKFFDKSPWQGALDGALQRKH
jgi:hypothetical protein